MSWVDPDEEMRVMKDTQMKDSNGRIMFGGDGRHRIHAASITNGLIPVWIIKYKDPKTVNMEYFKTNYANGQWRFLKTI